MDFLKHIFGGESKNDFSERIPDLLTPNQFGVHPVSDSPTIIMTDRNHHPFRVHTVYTIISITVEYYYYWLLPNIVADIPSRIPCSSLLSCI